jgi:hypothetical protein
MTTTRRISFLSLLVFSILASGLQALQLDPPGRAARVNFYQGSLSFRPASLDDWAPVNRNYPLTTGDEVWADDGSRGEIHVGRATVLRLAPRTAFSFLNLDDDTTQLRLGEGSVALTVERLDGDEVIEVATPNGAVSVLRPGFYRVDVDEQRYETRVTVREGEAEVLAGGGALPVGPGETLLVSGDEADPRYDLRDALARDGWEEWCLERDRREERFESRRYVPTDMVGYEDLDEYGRWSDSAEYGRVWTPRNVAADWAPYRYGQWSWVQPWGWTWVDDAPWGFAPFHYGRWARFDNGWGWIPGSSPSRPVYAPALVAFLDGVPLSGGTGLGWLPLGPRDVYVPWYQASPGYIRSVNQRYVPNVNIVNPANVTYTYAHLSTPGAVTAVNRDVFVAGRPIAKAAVALPAQQARNARVRPTVVQSVKPRRESVVGASAVQASAPRPPARVRERPVVVRESPPPPPKRLVGEGQLAAASPPPVRPAAREGQTAKLRPAREGLPAPREVRSGERPRARAREDARREPEREDPATARPDAAKPAAGQPPAAQRPAAQPPAAQPPAASTAPMGQRQEPPEPPERAREERRENPPHQREAPKSSAEPAKEPVRQPDRARERPDKAREQPSSAPVTPRKEAKPPAASPIPGVKSPESPKPDKAREQPAAAPAAPRKEPKPPAASPIPGVQAPESPKPDKAREQPAPDRAREREKAKGKPSPKPTPTPTPIPESGVS